MLRVCACVSVRCPGPVVGTVVTKNTLTAFNCSTSNGVSTLVAEPSILCGVPGGPQSRMKTVAVVAMVFFVLGVPIAFGCTLMYNAAAITADQYMRVWGEGESALTNPHIHIRHRFRKLYEDYKPQFMYWKVWLRIIRSALPRGHDQRSLPASSC